MKRILVIASLFVVMAVGLVTPAASAPIQEGSGFPTSRPACDAAHDGMRYGWYSSGGSGTLKEDYCGSREWHFISYNPRQGGWYW